MKYIYGLLVIVLLGAIPACHGDRILSEYLFEKYCNEEGRVGQFIYERVGLGDEYFIPIPKDPRKVNFHFIVDDNLMIDKSLLEQDYVFSKYSEVTPLSVIGPISSLETSVTRRHDNKLLGKSVSLSNRQGWLAERNILGLNEGDSCPRGYDKSTGSHKASLLHATFIKNLFYRK